MKISFNRMIIAFATFLLLLSIGFIILLISEGVSITIVIYSAMFIILFFMLGVVFMMCTRVKMQKVLSALSLTIQSLISEDDNSVFSDIEDSMLSKLQQQIIRLSSILKSHNVQINEEKDKIKSLISDIAHQLKTPLANLNMYKDLVLDSKLDQNKRIEFSKKMDSQIEKLNWLIQGLVQMSRLETGIIKFSPIEESIEDTVLVAIRQAYPSANSKNSVISFRCNESLKLVHDKKWTAEALFNIIDNAIKYTHTGGKIDITVTKYELFIRIDIVDDGEGLDESEINNIFKRFYRGENAKTIDGIGIGLYLAREIISRQGGYIKVKSEKKKGSTFSVFLLIN